MPVSRSSDCAAVELFGSDEGNMVCRCAAMQPSVQYNTGLSRIDHIFLPLGLEEVVIKPLDPSPPCPTFNPELIRAAGTAMLPLRK